MELLFFVVGIATSLSVMGAIYFNCSRKNDEVCGTLEIDMTNPDIPYIRLLTTCQVEDMASKKTVIFKVNPNATFTREKQGL